MPKRAVALMIVAAIAGGSASARAATGSLYAAFDHQSGHDIGIYPLDSSAAMTFITAPDPESLTVAGGTLYWIDGVDVKSANLAVNPPGIASVPEASTWTMMLAGSAGLALIARRRLRKGQQQRIAANDLGSRSAGWAVAAF
ncbi:MAG: PEP-CTERM sorting domain-containing protein [Roseiarcus sp.]